MKRLFLPLAIAVSFLVPPALAQEASPTPRVVVTGEGESAVSPDMADVVLSVTREAETARQALDDNSAAMADVIQAMKDEGIESRDLQTSGLSISPRRVHPDARNEDERPRIVGYEVTNTLTVRVRDLDKLGGIIDGAVTLGVNQGGNITFTNEDPSAALDEARRRAVENAIAKARTMTEAAGVELGEILELSEQTSPEPPMPMQARAMHMEAADSVPVEAGENRYSVRVTVTFALEQ